MTTIATDGKWVAADKQMTMGCYKTKTRKLSCIQGLGVISFAGHAGAGVKALRWWQGGCDGDPPEFTENEIECGIGGILVTEKGIFALQDGIIPLEIDAPFFAIGSGAEYAIAAMSLGKTPEEAVKEASKHDIYTSDEVDVVAVLPWTASPKKTRSKKK